MSGVNGARRGGEMVQFVVSEVGLVRDPWVLRGMSSDFGAPEG